MITILTCLAIAAFLPLLPHAIASMQKLKEFDKFDNNEPRKQNLKLGGLGSRALAAQQNAWEALAVFTVACLIVVLGQGDLEKAATASLLFILCRVAHTTFYLVNMGTPRSVAYFAGIGACIYMMYLGLSAASM